MRLLKDKNGKTESEFLREYDITRYFRPSVTVDAVVYRAVGDTLKVLFVERGGHPFIGMYAFPGGFVEENESCETAVARELYEETGISDVKLRQLVTVSTPGRDPRWRNITVVYSGRVDNELAAEAGDDAAKAKWLSVRRVDNATLEVIDAAENFVCKLNVVRDVFGRIDINSTEITERGRLAFDHAKILAYLTEAVSDGNGER